jgi:hypothetical protein
MSTSISGNDEANQPSSPWTHLPLNHNSEQIRLLHLTSPSPSGLLSLKLKVFRIKNISYTALSYTWGSSDDSKQPSILLNGHPVSIGCKATVSLSNLQFPVLAIGKPQKSLRMFQPELRGYLSSL